MLVGLLWRELSSNSFSATSEPITQTGRRRGPYQRRRLLLADRQQANRIRVPISAFGGLDDARTH